MSSVQICPLPFEKCKEIIYNIYTPEGEVDGSIKHLYYGLSNECVSKADQYGITYPVNSSVEDKVLITMAAVFIDYLWFENF